MKCSVILYLILNRSVGYSCLVRARVSSLLTLLWRMRRLIPIEGLYFHAW